MDDLLLHGRINKSAKEVFHDESETMHTHTHTLHYAVRFEERGDESIRYVI